MTNPRTDGTKPPTQMSQMRNWRRQSTDFALLHGDRRNTEQCRDLFATNEDVIVQAGKIFKKLEISIHNQTELQYGPWKSWHPLVVLTR